MLDEHDRERGCARRSFAHLLRARRTSYAASSHTLALLLSVEEVRAAVFGCPARACPAVLFGAVARGMCGGVFRFCKPSAPPRQLFPLRRWEPRPTDALRALPTCAVFFDLAPLDFPDDLPMVCGGRAAGNPSSPS